MDFTKRDTNIGKGIAICLMVIHHLFNSKTRILEGNSYIPVLYYIDIEPYIAQFGKICIASFLFLSGYGLFLGFQKSNKKIITYVTKKLIKFYTVFWALFIVFVPIGFLFFNDVTIINQDTLRYVVDLKIILMSFLGMSNRFNGAWWFVTLYIQLLLLIFPLYYYLMNNNIKVFIIINALLFLINYSFDIPSKLLFWQTSFAFGMFCAKYNIFSTRLIEKADKLNFWGIITIICLCFLLRFRIGMVFDFILAPVFIYSSIRLVKYCKMNFIFEYLGAYSFPMWLNHNFFGLYFFQNIMFYPKYSPVIIIFVLISSLISSVVIEKLRLTVFMLFQRITKKDNNALDKDVIKTARCPFK
jgi:hypothetical protein